MLDVNRPDKLDLLIAAVQGIHFLVGDAAMGHDHFPQLGKRRQDCFDLFRGHGDTGEIQLLRIIGEQMPGQLHTPDKADLGIAGIQNSQAVRWIVPR